MFFRDYYNFRQDFYKYWLCWGHSGQKWYRVGWYQTIVWCYCLVSTLTKLSQPIIYFMKRYGFHYLLYKYARELTIFQIIFKSKNHFIQFFPFKGFAKDVKWWQTKLRKFVNCSCILDDSSFNKLWTYLEWLEVYFRELYKRLEGAKLNSKIRALTGEYTHVSMKALSFWKNSSDINESFLLRFSKMNTDNLLRCLVALTRKDHFVSI